MPTCRVPVCAKPGSARRRRCPSAPHPPPWPHRLPLEGAPGVARLRQHPLARALQQPCGMGFALQIRRFIGGSAVHPPARPGPRPAPAPADRRCRCPAGRCFAGSGRCRFRCGPAGQSPPAAASPDGQTTRHFPASRVPRRTEPASWRISAARRRDNRRFPINGCATGSPAGGPASPSPAAGRPARSAGR